MRKFQVTVNGNSYEVEVEEVSAEGAKETVSAAPAVKAAPVKAQPKKAASGNLSGEAVKAPMPGTILDVKVNVGDTVKAGQAVCVLEAMKMENEIPASKDGKIAQVLVQKGATVEVGTPLVTIA